MKRKDIEPGKTYVVDRFGSCGLARVLGVEMHEASRNYFASRQPSRGTWRVRYMGLTTRLEDDELVLRETFEQTVTLGQVRRQVDAEDWLADRKRQRRADLLRADDYRVAQEHVKELAALLSEAMGAEVRHSCTGEIHILKGQVANWARRTGRADLTVG